MSPSHPSNRRIRMKDVADRCGVSLSTVSLVLSGSGKIPPETTRQVLEVVKAMGYRPSVLARSLAHHTARSIAVILPADGFDAQRSYVQDVLEAIHSQTQPSGFKLVVEVADRRFLSRRYYLRMLKEQSVDGVIYLAASSGDRFLKDMEGEPFPFVLFGNGVEGVSLPAVIPDHASLAALAVNHLKGLGHQTIGFLGGPEDVSAGRERRLGFLSAVERAGLKPERCPAVAASYRLPVVKEQAERLIASGITGLVISSDSMAPAVWRAARQQERIISETLAVVGIDDLQLSNWMAPSLSSVDWGLKAAAIGVAQSVCRWVQAPEVEKQWVRVSLEPPRLVIRESCGGIT